MIFEPMDRIVFAGDSVTDMGSAQPVGEGLFDNVGQSYVRIIENMLSTWYPEVYLRVTNSGVSGNTSRDLLQRFDSDVVALNPDWVSICIGINDVWRQFDSPAIPDGQVMPEEYEANLEKMILSVKGKVKGIFILTPIIWSLIRRTGCEREWTNTVRSAKSWLQSTAAVWLICRRYSTGILSIVILPILHGTECIRT